VLERQQLYQFGPQHRRAHRVGHTGHGLAALFPPYDKANVFYVGPNGQVYNWSLKGYYWSSYEWTNSALGAGEAADAGDGLALAWQPSGTDANVYYVGANGQMYNWYWNGSSWANNPLGAGEAAGPGTAVATAWQPNGTDANVCYVGANGQVYNWCWNGSSWANNQL
jgi:hypothetical protein